MREWRTFNTTKGKKNVKYKVCYLTIMGGKIK